MTTRNRDKALVGVVTAAASGNARTLSIDDEALFDELGDEFDFVVLEPGPDGDLILRPRFRDARRWIDATPIPLAYDPPGGITAAISTALRGDHLDLVFVQPGSSALKGLADLAASVGATIVAVNGSIDAPATMRRWHNHLDLVDLWSFDAATTVDFFDPDGLIDRDRITVQPIWRDQLRRVDQDEALPAPNEPLRFGLRVGRFAQRSLVWADRLAKRLPPNIEVHIFGAPPGASRRGVTAHADVDPAFFPDMLRLAGIHAFQVGATREAGAVLQAAILAGIPVLSPPQSSESEVVRRESIGWLVGPEDLTATAELLMRLQQNRFELDRATRRARNLKIPTGRGQGVRVASHIRRLAAGR